MSAEADLMKSTTNKEWVRPPISAQFHIPGFRVFGSSRAILKGV